MEEIAKVIKDEIDSADIVLFMKGTPVFPQCGFSGQVVQILSHIGVPFKGINVLEDDNLREGIKAFPIGRPFRSFMSRASLSAVAILSAKCLRRANCAPISAIRH